MPTDTAPIPMVLHCPVCCAQHIDQPEPEKGWTNPPHRSHLCARCGHVWRPCDLATTGVAHIESRGEFDRPHAEHPALRVLRQLTHPDACSLTEGDRYCWAHHHRDPCPHGLAKKLLGG